MRSVMPCYRVSVLSLVKVTVFLAAILGSLATQAQPVERREILASTIWMQSSLDYRVAAEQTYGIATQRLTEALLVTAATGHPAAVEQENARDWDKLPPAVVLDLDETVLDNSPYQAWMAKTGKQFDPASWNQWVLKAEAGAVPGSLRYVLRAKELGIRVVYISNRECPTPRPAPCEVKAKTIQNLVNLSFPKPDPDEVMLRGEATDWGTKDARRTELAKTHRIIMMIGDDLKDFWPSKMADDFRKNPHSPELEKQLPRFGRQWFALPNPTYGSWDDFLALQANDNKRCALSDDACHAKVLRFKYNLLQTFEPGAAPAGLAWAQRGGTRGTTLRVATWNIEWLNDRPVRADQRLGCLKARNASNGKPGEGVCGKPLRNAADYEALKAYFDGIAPDVVALQEVKNAKAAAQVIDPARYEFYFTKFPQEQNVGVAVRKDRVRIVKAADYSALGVGSVRYGADLTVEPIAAPGKQVRLLAVHLKSGCFNDPLDSDRTDKRGGKPCVTLQKQVPELEKWIDQRAAEPVPFLVLGDFNRNLDFEAQGSLDGMEDYVQGSNLWMWQEISDGDPPEARLFNTVEGKPIKCGFKKYSNFIDNILASRSMAKTFIPGSFRQHAYDERQFLDHYLSDHCMVTSEFRIATD